MRSFSSRQNGGGQKAQAQPGRFVVGTVSDSAEREANLAATRVMSGQRVPGQIVGTWTGRNSLDGVTDSVASRELFPAAGKPLGAEVRSDMESRFKLDLSRIRIHHDEAAERAAEVLSARAFTQGSHIAFGKGQYAPQLREGQRLLAHELAHVVQQVQTPSAVVRRSPALDGQKYFEEGNSSKVDKVIAASPVKNFIDPRDMKTLSTNVDMQSPTVFAEQYKKYGESDEDVNSVPGFVNRKEKKPIKLRAPGTNDQNKPVLAANNEVAVHEAVHLNSKTSFQSSFGHPYNEGVTEHFTEAVLGEDGKAYRDQLGMANGLIQAAGSDGEKQVGEAFFNGKSDLFQRVTRAFGTENGARNFRTWQDKSKSKEPADWQTATTMVTNALQHPSPPPAPPRAATPAQGSGAKP